MVATSILQGLRWPWLFLLQSTSPVPLMSRPLDTMMFPLPNTPPRKEQQSSQHVKHSSKPTPLHFKNHQTLPSPRAVGLYWGLGMKQQVKTTGEFKQKEKSFECHLQLNVIIVFKLFIRFNLTKHIVEQLQLLPAMEDNKKGNFSQHLNVRNYIKMEEQKRIQKACFFFFIWSFCFNSLFPVLH